MIKTLWWLNLLSGSAQLDVYEQLAHDRFPSHTLSHRLLQAVAIQGQREFGNWPEHQEAAARPRGESGEAPPMLEALVCLARRYLCWQGGCIGFRPEHFLEWREQLGHRLDPDLLVMTAAALDIWGSETTPVPRKLDQRAISQITGAPLIPPVALHEVETIKRMGLTEVHRHLSLSRLPGLVWCDALRIRQAPAELLPPAGYGNWSQLFRHACAIRRVLRAYLLVQIQAHGMGENQIAKSWGDRALAALQRPNAVYTRDEEQPPWPYKPRHHLPGARLGRVSGERALLFHCLQQLTRPDCPRWVSWLLHVYLLLRQLAVSAILQPPLGQKGLDRFKTLYVDSFWHDLGDASAKKQVLNQAWRTGGVTWFEAKVSPKRSVKQHLDGLVEQQGSLLQRLWTPGEGWHGRLLSQSAEEERPALRLTFHFIKKPEVKRESVGGWALLPRVCFRHLREECHRQGLHLLEQAQDPSYAPFIVGLDVASLETEVPIEVFAPVLKAMRSPWPIPPLRVGKKKRLSPKTLGLSVHAGEEFRHIAEGMRRVVETLKFCGYQAGDRIGHGLAIGLEPQLWSQRWHRLSIMPRLVRLDDVVWVWSELDALPQHAALRTRLRSEARTLFGEIYGHVCDFPGMDVLLQAWTLRGEDPLSCTEIEKTVLPPTGALKRFMSRSLQSALERVCSQARQLWVCYLTDPKVAKRGAKLIDVEHREDEMVALRDLQDVIIERLVRNRIAIEVNPSSNLAISSIERIVEHPVYRWAGPDNQRDFLRPTVVVGSDDPAIFGSELVHEYALLALGAEQRGASPRTIAAWIKSLHEDAVAYRFE